MKGCESAIETADMHNDYFFPQFNIDVIYVCLYRNVFLATAILHLISGASVIIGQNSKLYLFNVFPSMLIFVLSSVCQAFTITLVLLEFIFIPLILVISCCNDFFQQKQLINMSHPLFGTDLCICNVKYPRQDFYCKMQKMKHCEATTKLKYIKQYNVFRLLFHVPHSYSQQCFPSATELNILL